MRTTCILTDSSVQFLNRNFPGMDFVKVIPLEVNYNGNFSQKDKLKVKNLPAFASEKAFSYLSPPSYEKFRETFSAAISSCDEVVGIFHSSQLSSFFTMAQKTVNNLSEKGRIQLIDSQTISTGLGFLVQSAAQSLVEGATATDLERLICSMIPQIYTVLCIPGLSYLYYNEHLDFGQAVIGEMLELIPTFVLEEGKLSPLEKLRNLRHLTDFYQEFLGEFESLQHITLLQSAPPNLQMARVLRERLWHDYPDTHLKEHKMNITLATMFGPRSTGVIAIEALD